MEAQTQQQQFDNPIMIGYPQVNNLGGLCMSGAIRTKQKCPICKKGFNLIFNGLVCEEHRTIPTRYYIDIYWKRKLRIYSDNIGLPIDSFRKAQRLLEKVRCEIDEKKFDPERYIKKKQEVYRIGIYLLNWLTDFKTLVDSDQRSPSTYESYSATIKKYLIPFFENSDIREIVGRDIKELIKSFPPELKPKTLKNHLDNFKKILHEAHRIKDIVEIPYFPPISVPENDTPWIEEKTQDEIIENIDHPMDMAIVQFILYHGTRSSEACALQIRYINVDRQSFTPSKTFSRGKLRDRTKTAKVRPRPIHDDMIETIKECSRDKLPNAFLFINPRTGKHYTHDVVRRLFKKAKDGMGIDINVHQAGRHSLGSQAIQRGQDIEIVRRMLGHTKSTTTQRYIHTNTNTLKRAMRPARNVINFQKKRGAQ